MVDTLAPKRVFTQRDLDKSLIQPTPVGQSIMSSAPNVLESSPNISNQKSLTDMPQPDYVIDKNEVFNMMQKLQKESRSMVAETGSTFKSSEETRQEKQTGMQTKKQETPQAEGLVMRPIEYAAKGLKDKNVSGPILTGEKGPELIVPTGDGKISILDAKTTGGLLTNGATQASSIVEKPAPKPEASPIDDDAFIEYMKTVENAPLLAGDTSKLQHNSAEGGNDTVAFGHKLTDEEVSSGKVYGYDYTNLSTDQANDIFNRDINKAHTVLIDKFGSKYTGLDNKRKQILIDFQYNLGSLNAFPLFRDAVFENDTETMMKEYKRFFKDPKSGDMKPLGRNKNFNDFFFDGEGIAMNSIMSQPIRKAEKGAEDVEIGSSRAMPSGPPPNTEPEPEEFDFNKLTYGKNRIDINYFYDNLDAIATHGFKQRFGQDLEPNSKQLKDARDEAMAKLSAIIAMKIDKVDGKILDSKREEYIKPDPYDPSGKRKQELFDEYGPEILPEA